MDKRTLLIIEDDEINREFLAEILKDRYQVLVAENGRDGLDILKERGKDIAAILLDIQMPVMNGFEFLEYVGQNSVYSKIPVVVTTVLDSVGDEKRCLELGASDFIVKPYNRVIVQLRVENVIRLRECDGIISELEMDALTGFKTRKAYYHDIEMIEQNEEKSQHPVGVVFMDINGLKETNDNFGHKAGDKLIASIARNVSEVFSEAGRYRFGGDEFVLLSFDENRETFENKIRQLVKLWEDDYSAAVGSIWLDHAKDLEKSIAIADKRMYLDKSRHYEKKMQDRRRSANVETEEILEKVQEISEFIPGGFFIYHADGEERLITYNQELLKLFGCASETEFLELTGNSFRGMVHPEDLEFVECDISKQIRQDWDLDRVKYRIICKDGTEKKVLDYGRFVHTERYGDVYYVFMNEIIEEE